MPVCTMAQLKKRNLLIQISVQIKKGEFVKIILIIFFGMLILKDTTAGVKTETVEYKQGNIILEGYLAYDESLIGKRPGVLVVHDWLGISAATRKRAEQLAELGYVVLAADIYGKGIRPANAQEAQTEAMKYYRTGSFCAIECARDSIFFHRKQWWTQPDFLLSGTVLEGRGRLNWQEAALR